MTRRPKMSAKRPLSALISNLGSFPWGSPATLMLTDACMIREGSKVRLQGTLPSDYQLEPPVRLAAPGRGFGYAFPLRGKPQSTILNCVSNVHAHQIL